MSIINAMEVKDSNEMAKAVRGFVMTNLAREVNDEVIRRLPIKERESLKGNENSTSQRVKNEYFAFSKASDDFKKVHVDFFVRLGHLSGTHKIKIDRHFRRKPKK